MADLKPLGKCPHCHENVRAKVIEECDFTRDVCECPECEEKILVCRTPGCHNYAVEKNLINELCPECAEGLMSAGKKVATGAASLFVTILLNNKFKK